MNQIRAVVESDQLHAVRKTAAVQALHLLFELAKGRQGLFASLQQNDPFDGIVVVIHADLSEARLRILRERLRHRAEYTGTPLRSTIRIFCISGMERRRPRPRMLTL